MGNFLLGLIIGVVLGMIFKNWALINLIKLKDNLFGKKEQEVYFD